MLKRLERLNDQMLLCVLGGQSEDVDDNVPSRFEVLGLRPAHVGHRHDNEFLDLKPSI